MKYLIDKILFEGVAKAQQVYVDTQKIDKSLFDELVGLDPTPQKKYIEWMCKIFVVEEMDPANFNLFSALKDFDKMVQKKIIKGSDSDINSYKTLESLVDKVNQNRDTKTKGEVEKETKIEGAEVVFDNDKCRIYKIHSKEASCIYGSGTKWCTAASHSSNYFNSYYFERGVNLYYILPKGDLLHSIGKYAVAVHSDAKKEVFNAADARVSNATFSEVAMKLGIEL